MATLDGRLCGSELLQLRTKFTKFEISGSVDSLTELPGDQDVDMLPNNLLLPGAADATHGAAVRLQATVRRRSVMRRLHSQALLHRLRCEAVWQEAAMRIQAAWRSYDAAVVEGVHIAAALIQAAWRSYDAAACIKAEYAAEAGAAAAAVRLQAAVRGCLQRVYWRSETWGSDAEGPPLTVTMHLRSGAVLGRAGERRRGGRRLPAWPRRGRRRLVRRRLGRHRRRRLGRRQRRRRRL